MDLIDDIDLIFPLVRLESRALDELTDILDSVIARAIYFYDIEHRLIVEGSTVRTYMTWIPIFGLETVQCLREDTSACRLPSSTRSMKEVGMVYTSSRETIS